MTRLQKSLILGLDDIAHNRMSRFINGRFRKVTAFGTRNKKCKCYCALIKRLKLRERP